MHAYVHTYIHTCIYTQLPETQGATILGDALVQNLSIHVLKLDGNKFGKEGYKAIAQHRYVGCIPHIHTYRQDCMHI